MDLLATKIELDNKIGRDEIWDLIKEWLIESPHYKINDIAYNGTDEVFEQKYDSVTLNVLNMEGENEKNLACRFTNTEDNIHWYTDVIYVEKEASKSVSVKLSRSSDSYNVPSRPINKPHIIKMLFEKDYTNKDGCLAITDFPIHLTSDNLEQCAKIMTGQNTALLPVVYLSYDSYNCKHYSVDPDSLAKKLSGLAHVVIETDLNLSFKLKELTDGNNAYNGYVGIYYPGNDRGEILALQEFFKEGILDKKAFAQEIYERIRQTKINHSECYDLSWEKLQLEYQRRQYISRSTAANKISKEYENTIDYVRELEKENRNLEEKIKQLTEDNNNKRYTIESLKIKADSAVSVPINKGSITEFYPGEINDLIINLINQIAPRIPEDTRAGEIVASLISNNQYVGIGRDMLNKLKSVLKLTNLESRWNSLESLGFAMVDGKHDKMYFKEPKYSFTLAKTKSDKCSTPNSYSDIDKKISVYKDYIKN